MVLELLTQSCFLNFAGRSVRDFVDEGDIIRHPPFGDFPVQMFKNRLFGQLGPVPGTDNQKRAFIPFRMRQANHGGFCNIRVADGNVFNLNAGDPFTAGLDDILGPVRDLDKALRVNGSDITGVKIPVLVKDIPTLAFQIFPDNERPLTFRLPNATPSRGSSLLSSSVIFKETR